MRSFVSALIILVLISFENTAAAQDGHTQDQDKLIWITSSSSRPANTETARASLEFATQPRGGRINIRSKAAGQPIEVYNFKHARWVQTQAIFENNFSINANQTQQMKSLSECDHISNLTVQFEDSTQKADVYVDGYPQGQTDKYGMFKKPAGAVCKGDESEVALRKTKCDSFTEKFAVIENPYLYRKTQKLKCR